MKQKTSSSIADWDMEPKVRKMGTQEGMQSRIVGKILNEFCGQWTLSYEKFLKPTWSPIWLLLFWDLVWSPREEN